MWLFTLILDAALMGIIIAVVAKDAFPGWGAAIGVVFATGLATAVVGMFLPGFLGLIANVVGAVVGAFAISWLCQLDLRTSLKAAGIYLGVSLVLHVFALILF